MIVFKHERGLRILLYAGAVYFLGVAMVHSLGIKVPGLFVYFNVPSYAYQDRIISFLAFGWSGLFYLTGRKLDLDLIKLILVIGLVAVLALLTNTLITDFSALAAGVKSGWFLLITGGLFCYWVLLLIYSWERLKLKK